MLLTNAAQIRALTESEAAQHRLVWLRGVAIGEAEPEGEAFAIQDETAGIYFNAPASLISTVRRGDLLEVEGITDPGQFAPYVIAKKLRKLGTSKIPEPRQVAFEQLITGHLDAQWVQASGVVRNCESNLVDSWNYRLELATGGGRLTVKVYSAQPLESLVDAEVRVQGVCYYQFNTRRQLLGPILSVPHGVSIIVETPAPQPNSTPLSSSRSLLQFVPQGAYGHRVHVRGIVTFPTSKEFFWIRDGAVGLRVQTRQSGDLAEGDQVDVVGFPNRGEYVPILEDAVFQKSISGPPPSPCPLSDLKQAVDHDADLVEIDADLIEKQVLIDGYALALRCEGTGFTAMLRTADPRPLFPNWLPGSKVRIRGICSVASDHSERDSGVLVPRGVQLLLRSPADLTVLRPPPWWTREHIFWLFSGVTFSSLLVVGGVILASRVKLREQKVRRAMAEAEFSAILAERNRMAREIHDTLAQGLGAISMQLELVRDQKHLANEKALKHLELAHRLVRNSLNDARNSIWNMRSQILETGDLPSALATVLKQLTDDTEVASQMTVIGQVCRLPPVTENALLRVSQEAITNSMKHARARLIEVRLEFETKQVRLSIRDDGCGFDVAQAPLSKGSFGLVGMRERLAQLPGKFIARSCPGQGTEITVTVAI